MDSLDNEIRRFVVENYLFGQDSEELSNQDSLLHSGIVDSTGVLELVQFLERRFQIAIRDEDLIPENLDSIERVSAFVRHLTEGGNLIAS